MAAIVAGDLLVKYSVTSGSAGGATAGTATGSLGTYVSTTQWTGGTKNDLLPDVSGSSNAASVASYRCVFMHNTNTANTLTAAVAYLAAETAGGASISIAVDPTAASPVGSSSAQALTAASGTSPGSSVTSLAYSSPTTAAGGISLGDLPSGYVKAIWVKQQASNSSAASGDSVTVAFAGDTGSA